MLIDTPLLVVGHGPGPLVVAKVAAAYGLACLLVGHEVVGGDAAVPLSAAAVAELARHGLVDVLRPYFDTLDPPTIAPAVFEDVIKHHCVADLNVTVYDKMSVVERIDIGSGLRAVLTDGRTRWDLAADALVDSTAMPTELSAAIVRGAAAAVTALTAARSSRH